MNSRKLIRSISLPLFFLLFSIAAFAQTSVSGRVTDANGVGLANVTVAVKGSNVATTTNESGQFTITVPAEGKALVLSSVGYGSREVSLNGRTSITASLQTASTSMNEVVVVGYGTVRKRDLTGSVSTVSSKDFQKGVITTPEQLIAGKVPGVQITSNSGAPGAGSTIRIRGGTSISASNDPLIVIDGLPLDMNGIAGAANPLNLINPNDIETFTVLKDASATAIYGNRAANGVIIITTKKGSSGKLKIGFSTVNSIGAKTGEVKVLTADEFRSLVKTQGSAADVAFLGSANTNWQDQIYQKAFASDNNLSLTGGIPNVPYRLNLGFLDQNGILKTGNLKRMSASLNLNPRLLNNHLTIDANAKFSHTNTVFANEGAIGSAVYFDPTKPVMSGKGGFGGYYEWTLDDSTLNTLAPKNPVGLLNQRQDKSKVNRFIGNLQFDYKMHFLPDLHANLNLGLDKSHGEGTINVPSSAASDFLNYPADTSIHPRVGGVANSYSQDKTNKLLEFYLSYGKDIKSIRSRVDAVAGYSYQDFTSESPSVASYNALGQVHKAASFSVPSLNTLLSFYGRVNYSYASKYLATVTLRRDGSSRFSEKNRWGNFPSAALAWNIKEESFLKNSKALSNLKIRFGWGIVGQQEGIRDYGYQPFFFYGDSAAKYQFGNTFYTVIRPQEYDENLRWEQTESRNVGVDLGFFNNRLGLTADYYNRTTKDLLFDIVSPPGSNFSNHLLTNVGNSSSQGLEFGLTGGVVRRRNFTLDVAYNITYIIKYEITKLQLNPDPKYLGTDVGSIGINGNIQKLAVGYAPNVFFLYKQVYDQSGKPIEGVYEDINRDGKIDEYDKVYSKNPNSNVYMGFSANATYNKFFGGFTMRSNLNNYVYNNVKAGSGIYNNISSGQRYLNNGSADILNSGFKTRQTWSDYYLENASFLKMDNLFLGYNFGRVMHDKANLRLSFNVQNVFVVTKYTGLDPEVNGGIDGGIYPRPRTFALGINLDF